MPFPDLSLEKLNARSKGTMLEHLGIEITGFGETWLKGTMPVDERTFQPMRILHGGASVVLAETLGSIAANLLLDPKTHYAVGLDINANHIRSARSGRVTGVASPLHLGRSTQVWEIRITDDEDKLVCISRLTMAVMPHS